MQKVTCFSVLFFFITLPVFLQAVRSPFRKQDPWCPRIDICWHDNQHQPAYVIQDSHIEIYPIFSRAIIDENNSHFLPDGPIPTGIADQPPKSGELLKQKMEELIHEINNGATSFKYFSVLQQKNFNKKKKCGLIVLKFKDEPFVLKLFMETPATFANPYCKGIAPLGFFFIAGGSNRHISGLTRIKNAYLIKKTIAQHPFWASKIIVPHKWFWTPKNSRDLFITGNNLGRPSSLKIAIPSIYGVIADAIPIEKKVIKKRVLQDLIMKLCNDLSFAIDPHEDNFVVTRINNSKTLGLAIIDTEHFPSLVGLKKHRSFRNHHEWFCFLLAKCIKTMYGRTKRERREALQTAHELALFEAF